MTNCSIPRCIEWGAAEMDVSSPLAGNKGHATLLCNIGQQFSFSFKVSLVYLTHTASVMYNLSAQTNALPVSPP